MRGGPFSRLFHRYDSAVAVSHRCLGRDFVREVISPVYLAEPASDRLPRTFVEPISAERVLPDFDRTVSGEFGNRSPVPS